MNRKTIDNLSQDNLSQDNLSQAERIKLYNFALAFSRDKWPDESNGHKTLVQIYPALRWMGRNERLDYMWLAFCRIARWWKPGRKSLESFCFEWGPKVARKLIERDMKAGLISESGELNPVTGNVADRVCPELVTGSNILNIERMDRIAFAFDHSNDLEKSIMLGIMDGKPYEKMAEEIGISESKIKHMVQRLRARFTKSR